MALSALAILTVKKMSTGVKRTKTGCITCRIRRVKCDELKPECNRCKSTGRKCDGYSPLPFSRRDLHAASTSNSTGRSPPGEQYDSGPLSTLVTDPAFSDVLEKRYFQFFRHRTVASTNSLVAAHFWDRTVLQACHLVPAVKHAVLALSSWHQYSTCGSDPQFRDYADKQYQIALERARDLVSSARPQDIDKVLTTCVVFICFEGVRGNYAASQQHMDNGRAIARQHVHRLKQSQRRNDLMEIQQTLFRLDLPAVCFSDISSPYHYSLENFMETDPNLVPWQFSTIFEARDSLIDLTRWMLVLMYYVDGALYGNDMARVAEIHADKERCSQRLRLWHEFFENVAKDVDPPAQLLVLNMRQWYLGVIALSKSDLIGPETRWDNVQDHFEAIVDIGEQLVKRIAQAEDGGTSFSYDFGYVITTFLVATRCRDPTIRRRAIEVMRAVPRQEGLWASVPAAAIAERWMEIEEEGHDVRCAADIPETSRVREINLSVSVADGKADAEFQVYDVCGENLTLRYEAIEW